MQFQNLEIEQVLLFGQRVKQTKKIENLINEIIDRYAEEIIPAELYENMSVFKVKIVYGKDGTINPYLHSVEYLVCGENVIVLAMILDYNEKGD